MKRILGLIICGVLVLGVTGCGDGNTNKNDNNDSNGRVQEDSNSSISINKKTYYCTQKDDDDTDYYFYYENDKLTKAEITTIYVSEYSEIKKEAEQEYTGVKVSKQNGVVLVEVDVLNGGKEYLYGETPLYNDESNNTTWQNVQKVMNEYGYDCEVN